MNSIKTPTRQIEEEFLVPVKRDKVFLPSGGVLNLHLRLHLSVHTKDPANPL